ncbi:MAG TPA: ergothioneine biosynthesis protein EgtB [Planctomycetales bacterium]|jgi:ergothioneine biosynthesis protein EgtB|nr:ergothioneine biosynthesis protein EgtB [Planctomycetales bacterium]
MQLEQQTLLRAGPSRLVDAYTSVRQQTERLCEPLAAEDYVVQSMSDASPVKWHLAHTSWFFETFVLAAACDDYVSFDSHFGFLFNSYYNAVGDRLPRARRGLLSRPTVGEIHRYRAQVDEQMLTLLRNDAPLPLSLASVVELGLHHEQQHQELILTDLKHAFGANPLRPAYRDSPFPSPPYRLGDPEKGSALNWLHFPAGVRWIGRAGDGFAFDNETPRHRVYVEAFLLADRLTTCGEYRAFLDAGGYDRPEAWLSDGWAARLAHDWTAPLYWEKHDGRWMQFTLDGLRPVRDEEPVCHLSFYEADAFARWSGARLPTEAEWEAAAEACPSGGSFLEGDHLHPSASPTAAPGTAAQMFGEAWQWTASPYVAYPGYVPLTGALGEYNGKFMCNQMVLRGGSCATARSHFRRSYRNFFPPEARWQFTGVRLARNP